MAKLDYDGRVVVVTGAGRGMGAAHATELAARGARVVVNDLGGDMLGGGGTSSEPAEQVVEAIAAAGGSAVANVDTVATAEGCAAIVAHAVSTYGRLDGILHNAGIAGFAPVAEMAEADYEELLRVHLFGAFNLTRAAWPHLAENHGRVLYISSGAGLYGVPTLAHYASAKVGMIGLMRVAAAEGRAAGIGVNVLAVAAATRMMEWMKETPNLWTWFERYMRPELPAAAATWLLHPDCPANGRVFEAFGPHVAEVVIGETQGYTKLDMTAENVRDHFAEIGDRSGELLVPADADEFHAAMFQFIIDAGAEPPLPDEGPYSMIVAGEPASSGATDKG
jgi:NAD(P)-dependent dehydrogenase (short-subunit alcohol dehydrogenase family)